MLASSTIITKNEKKMKIPYIELANTYTYIISEYLHYAIFIQKLADDCM